MKKNNNKVGQDAFEQVRQQWLVCAVRVESCIPIKFSECLIQSLAELNIVEMRSLV